MEILPIIQEGNHSGLRAAPSRPDKHPRVCSVACWVAVQRQLHMDMRGGHAGLLRTTKQNSGVGHTCPQASSDPSVPVSESPQQTGYFLTMLPPPPPCPHPLCELRAMPATCPSRSWFIPKTRGCFLISDETGEGNEACRGRLAPSTSVRSVGQPDASVSPARSLVSQMR